MKKVFLCVMIFSFLLKAEPLVIDAEKFEANDKEGISIFTGNVKLKQGRDRFSSDKLEVYVNKNSKKTVLSYVATDNVSFTIFSNGKEYEGKGDKLIFNIKDSKYSILGNGYLKEKIEDKTLFGETIIINKKTGEADVQGTKDKPVRFIININDDSDDAPDSTDNSKINNRKEEKNENN